MNKDEKLKAGSKLVSYCLYVYRMLWCFIVHVAKFSKKPFIFACRYVTFFLQLRQYQSKSASKLKTRERTTNKTLSVSMVINKHLLTCGVFYMYK